jgi:hypothetical protein
MVNLKTQCGPNFMDEEWLAFKKIYYTSFFVIQSQKIYVLSFFAQLWNLRHVIPS